MTIYVWLGDGACLETQLDRLFPRVSAIHYSAFRRGSSANADLTSWMPQLFEHLLLVGREPLHLDPWRHFPVSQILELCVLSLTESFCGRSAVLKRAQTGGGGGG